MAELVKKVSNFFTKGLWLVDLNSLTNFKAWLVYMLRLIYATVSEFIHNELTLRAMGLVYTTLLSLVPLLAFSVSLLKAFGVVENKLEPFLQKFLAPLGENGAEISAKIMEFISNMNFGVLGVVGLLMLIYTSISLIKKIEDSLNHIWKVKKGRSIARMFSDYLSTMLIGPLFMFLAIGLTASLQSHAIVQKILAIEPLGSIVILAGKLVPYLFVFLVFTFVYIIFPNTKVFFRSAFIGGAVAGIAWQTTGWVFTWTVAKSTRYAAIYSSLAVLILFMLWVYANWIILLVGAQISYCHQNLKHLNLSHELFQLTGKLREKLNLTVMYLIGDSYYKSQTRWSLDNLANHIGVPYDSVEQSIGELVGYNLLIEVNEDPLTYIPARDIENIKVKDIIDSARTKKDTEAIDNIYLNVPEVDAVSTEVEDAVRDTLGDLSLRDIITRHKSLAR